MKITVVILGILGFMLACSSTSKTSQTQSTPPSEESMTIEIDHFLQACTGEGPMLCEKYRKEGEDDWLVAYESIEGFEFEWGVRQTIEISCEGEDMSACEMLRVEGREKVSEDEEFSLVILDETGEPYLYPDPDDSDSWTYFGAIGAVVEGDEMAEKIKDLSPEGGTAQMGIFSYNSDRSQLILISIP